MAELTKREMWAYISEIVNWANGTDLSSLGGESINKKAQSISLRVEEKARNLQYSEYNGVNSGSAVHERMNCVVSWLGNLNGDLESTRQAITNLDQQRGDLLHALELLELDDSKKMILCNELKKISQARRLAKENEEILLLFVDVHGRYKSIIRELNSAVIKSTDIRKRQGTRKYGVRKSELARKLFAESDNENV